MVAQRGLARVQPGLRHEPSLCCNPCRKAMMTRDDYEAQKRRLAEQHRSLTEMVDAAYQTQLRALDMVWRMMSGAGTPEPPAPLPPATPAEPAAPQRRRLRAGELKNDVAAALDRLPDLFVFSDVYEAIGY